MKSMNKTQLIGYLALDPVIKEFESGTVLACLRIGTKSKIKNPPEGTDPYQTTWHEVKVWGRDRVEKIVNQFIKGSHIMVEGRLQYRSYTTSKGVKKYVTEINAYTLMNLDR